MFDGIQSRKDKLEARRDEIRKQQEEINTLLGENGVEISDLSQELNHLIGDAQRPTYVIDVWQNTIRESTDVLKLDSNNIPPYLLNTGKDTNDDV